MGHTSRLLGVSMKRLGKKRICYQALEAISGIQSPLAVCVLALCSEQMPLNVNSMMVYLCSAS